MYIVRTFSKIGEGGPYYLLFLSKMAAMSKIAAMTVLRCHVS